MALRIFVDSRGGEWQAFDVVPRANERRRYDRRSPAEQRAEDERREADRRLTVGGRSALVSSLSDGWLCFEKGSDCRRLSPIPEDWRRCTDQELEAYCDSAKPVRGSSASLEHAAQSEQ